MNVLNVQTKLKAAGYDPGPLDGDIGPKTYTALINYTVKKDVGSLAVLLGRAMAADFPKYDVTTGSRIAFFIAQSAHETGNFRYMQELGSGKDLNHDGFDDYLQRYDKRADLGNKNVGDGPRYRGRGIFQLTGYFNYLSMGKRIGIDLIKNPEKAAEPETATLIACLYWSDKKLNGFADAGDIKGCTKKINGGYNGLEERTTYTNRLLALLG
jgi:putative chitinase